MGSIREEDEHNHLPPDDNDQWQESWAFAWHDPLMKIGGWHHIGLARVRGVADAWSCIWEDGQPVHRFQDLTLPIPPEDLTSFKLGPLNLQTIAPLTTHRIAVDDPEKGVSATIECARTIDPVTFGYEAAKGHWEVYGAFKGEVTIGGRTTDVLGHSFIDRSWGARDWSNILTYRLIWAVFGDDLAFKLYTMNFKTGPHVFGFAILKGRQFGIRHIEIDAVMASDGVNPKGTKAKVWVENGEIYTFSGECEGSDIGIQQGGFMCGHANAVFQCGGRIGTGFIEVQELKHPPVWDAELQALARLLSA